jgi:hypothetical protein
MSMTFDSSSSRHPVIFDTGASLAITPHQTDFTTSLTLPPGDLRLGGMANGLKIEGIGSRYMDLRKFIWTRRINCQPWPIMFPEPKA